MKPILSQLLATAQLAEMAYTADPADHKKTAWEKALADYEQALDAADQETEPVLTIPANPKDVAFLERLSQELEQESQRLKSENAELKTENSLLKSQLIEKEGKVKQLEKSVLSAKTTGSEPAPAATPKPLTGAAKLAAEKKAAAAAATVETDDEKKS
jgi:hypothetical protein